MKVTENVFKIDATKGGYAFVIKGETTFMIDTGMPRKTSAILAELEHLGIKKSDIKHILLTHNDVDHVGNVAELARVTGATIWCSEIDIPYVLGEKQRFGFKKILSHLMKYEIPSKILPFDKEKLPLDLQIIETPGHTPGHVCFIYDNVLFAGDIIMSSGRKLTKSRSIMTWNMGQVDQSLKKILQYKFNFICAAHSEPIKVTEEVLHTINNL